MLVRVGQVAERGVGGVGHHELVGAEGVHLRGADQAQTVARAHAGHALHVLECREDAQRSRVLVSAEDRLDEGLVRVMVRVSSP